MSVSISWIEIKKLIQKLKQFDKRCAVFGSGRHRYKMNQPLTNEILDKYEEKNKIKLPIELREYYKLIGNGAVGPGSGVFDLNKIELDFFDVHEPYKGRDFLIKKAFETEEDPYAAGYLQIPMESVTGLLIIIHEGCENYIGIVCNGESENTVIEIHLDGHVGETGVDFKTYYFNWLNDKVKLFQVIEEKTKMGWSRSQIIDELKKFEKYRNTEYIESYMNEGLDDPRDGYAIEDRMYFISE